MRGWRGEQKEWGGAEKVERGGGAAERGGEEEKLKRWAREKNGERLEG